LAREAVVEGLVAELWQLRGVVADLTEDEWTASTRCEGWTVFDVAGHVTGVMADITAGRLDGVDTQPWYERQLAERRGRPPAALIEELDRVIAATAALLSAIDAEAWAAPAAPGVGGTVGRAFESLWCGTYIHNEDILAALGRPPVRGPGLDAAIAHIVEVLTERGWAPATLVLEGADEVMIAGGGRRIDADPLTFVLVASGREDSALLGLDPSVNIYHE
jgi:uncharacterized protein (TIGR03083 family)